MISYLLNVALVICTILVFYKVLLRKETFYKLNRFVLLTCLIFSFLLPLIHLPEQWTFSITNALPAPEHEEPLAPELQNGAAQSAKPAIVSAAGTNNTAPFFQRFSLKQAMIIIYWVGVTVFAINFIVQLITLLYRAYSRPVIRDGKFRIVELSGDQAPCSFGNNIFINPEKYDWDTYSQILLHEKIHVQQGHSYDILLAELALVFQWFNPFAWLYRKAVEDNLEFLTDNDLLKDQDIDPSSYQLSLVKVSAPHFPVSLTTNYNQSILKRRLIMMNAKRSNINTTWKYLFILPILVMFVCFLNEPIAYAKPVKSASLNNSPLDKVKTVRALDDEGNWFATINNNTINIRFQKSTDKNKDNGSSSTFELSAFKNFPKDKEGTFELAREAGTMHFKGKFDGDMGMGTYKFVPNEAFANSLRSEGITLDEKDDAMVFYMIDLKKSYIAMLKRQGFTDFTKDALIPLAALKVDEPFIKAIKSNGFSDVSLENLIPLKALGVDEAYLAEIKKSGYKNITVDQLITLKAQGISGDFLKSAMVANNVSKTPQKEKPERPARAEKPEQLERDEASERNEQTSLENIIAMKAMNVDAAFRNGFKQIGFNVSDEELIAMKSLNVSPDYIKNIQAAGFKDVQSEEVISMKALGITIDEIKAYRNLGFKDLKIEDVVAAKATGVTPAYISSMKKQGHNLNSLDKYVETKAITGSIN